MEGEGVGVSDGRGGAEWGRVMSGGWGWGGVCEWEGSEWGRGSTCSLRTLNTPTTKAPVRNRVSAVSEARYLYTLQEYSKYSNSVVNQNLDQKVCYCCCCCCCSVCHAQGTHPGF